MIREMQFDLISRGEAARWRDDRNTSRSRPINRRGNAYACTRTTLE